MEDTDLRNLEAIYDIRAFNRFFMNSLGIVDGNIPPGYPISKGRILFEIRKAEPCTFSILCNNLKIDPGYISRILRQITREGLIKRHESSKDRRSAVLHLTDQGNNKLDELINACNLMVHELIKNLSDKDIKDLVFCAKRIEEILQKGEE